MVRIPIFDKTTKNPLCQEKNGLPGISFLSTNLALKNETTWSKVLEWAATVPSQGNVH